MFGLEILDFTLLPAILIALVAGTLSFLSPCVLPIVPPYLAYISGVSMADLGEAEAPRGKVIASAAFFVLGLSTVFLLLGFTASAFGRFFLQNQDWFVSAAGIVIMIFGALKEHEDKALAHGMNIYLRKPVNYDQLRNTMIDYFSDN